MSDEAVKTKKTKYEQIDSILADKIKTGIENNKSFRAKIKQSIFGERRGRKAADIDELYRRLCQATGIKENYYKAAIFLVKRPDVWFTNKEIAGHYGFKTLISNKKRLSACMPVGYKAIIKKGKGLMATKD